MAPDTDLPGGCLVVGDLEATRMTCRLLTESGHPVVHLTRPTDAAVRTALASPTGRAVATGISTVVVIVRSDVQALRWALLVEHIVPGIALVVSVFDRTVAQQLRRVVPHCLATSAAEVAAPAIVAAVTGDALAVLPDGRLLLAGSLGGPGEEALSTSRVQTAAFAPPTAPWWHHLTAWVPRRQEGSAALMLAGVTSLLAILVLDWALTVVVLHEPPLRALYAATRVVTTVGPADAVGHQPPAGTSWSPWSSCCRPLSPPGRSSPASSTGCARPGRSACSDAARSHARTTSSSPGSGRWVCASASSCDR